MKRTLLCLGYGFTARALARRLADDGWSVRATARSAESAARLSEEGVGAFSWTEQGIEAAAFDGADAVLISTPPGAEGCPAFAAAAEWLAIKAGEIGWIGYLSSNAVYGDHGGAWVDERSALNAKSARALARVAAEAQWAGHSAEWALPLVIFRLAGIYGSGRSALDAVREGRARRIVKPGQVFNRIHVDDIARALKASIENPRAGELFNLTDDEPAPPQDVVEYACALLGVAPPPETVLEDAELSEMARSFYDDNKRVRNAAMKTRLGIDLLYPSHREGLAAILAEETARARG